MMLITTLPVKPRINAVAGYYFPFVIADIITKNLGGELIASLNSVAIDSSQVPQSLTRDMLNDFDQIDVNPALVMMDHIERFKQFVNKRVFEMIREGEVYSKQAEVYSCQCGLVETLDLKRGYEGTLITFEDGKPYCKSCQSPIEPEVRQALIAQEVDLPSKFRLIPDIYYAKLSKPGQKLISRRRKTAFSLICREHQIFIDTDFACQFYLDYLAQLYGFNRLVVATSSPSLNYLANALRRLGQHVEISVVSLPYLFASNQERMQEHSEYKLNSLLSKLGPLGFRLFLLQGMTLSQDSAVVEIERLSSVGKAERQIRANQVREAKYGMDELVEFLELNNIRSYIASPCSYQPVPVGLGGK